MNERVAYIEKLKLEGQIAHLKDICGDDPELLADMIEGETELDGFIGKMLALIGEDESIVSGINEYQKKVGARKTSVQNRIRRLRTLLASIVVDLPGRKYKHALGTINVSDIKPNIIINDESAIPSQFWIPQDPKLDQTALRAHLNARREALEALKECRTEEERSARLAEINEEWPDIAGVSLDNGDISVSIRT